MVALASDNFNRANQTGLGANWTQFTAQPQFNISSNTAVPADISTNDDFNFYSAVSFPNDQYSKMQATVSDSTGFGPGNVVRCNNTSGGNFYRYVTRHSGTNAIFDKQVNGTYTTVSNFTGPAWNDGDTWQVNVVGTTLTWLLNGVSQRTDTDSAVTSGSPGISVSTAVTSASIDNWEGGTFGGVLLTRTLLGVGV